MPTDWSENIVIVELSDEPALSEELGTVYDKVDQADEPRHVVLDFSRVSYINSSNLAQMLRLRKRMEERRSALRLAGVSGEIWSVMTVTGLDRVFTFAPDAMTALAGIQIDEDPHDGSEKPSQEKPSQEESSV